jgi:hypothetical protein
VSNIIYVNVTSGWVGFKPNLAAFILVPPIDSVGLLGLRGEALRNLRVAQDGTDRTCYRLNIPGFVHWRGRPIRPGPRDRRNAMPTIYCHPIWDLEELEQAAYIESMIDPFKEEIQKQYQEGPYHIGAKECWQEMRSWFPGLTTKKLADRLGLTKLNQGELARRLAISEGTLSRNIDDGVLTFSMLLAVMELARQYNLTLPHNSRVQVKLNSLPLAGVIYRGAGRIPAIRRADQILRTQKLAKESDQPDALLGLHTLAPWQFELLDGILTQFRPPWITFCKRFRDQELGLALRCTRDLQSILTENATLASQQHGLCVSDSRRLRELANDPNACGDLLISVFNPWQEAWLCTNHYAVQWEQW